MKALSNVYIRYDISRSAIDLFAFAYARLKIDSMLYYTFDIDLKYNSWLGILAIDILG